MKTDVHRLILYRNFQPANIFSDITWLMENYKNEYYNKEDMEALLHESIGHLVELSTEYGFEGNLWHCYLTFLLVNNENGFSTACEIKGSVSGSVNDIVMHDFKIFKGLYDFDFTSFEETLNGNYFSVINNYKNTDKTSKVFNKRIRDRIVELSKELADTEDESAFRDVMIDFYQEFGVGKLGLNKAFRIRHDEMGKVEIYPITSIEHVYLDDLVGYEIQKKKLIDNTEAFVQGRKANNCLLFGDSGTGKSSSIKAILNEYYSQGLRMVEIYKHQLKDLLEVIAQVKNRNYKFIIYMDDLSFEDFEIEYKYLKAVIEGGLEKKPDNVLIYATSNRRHIVREKWSDKEDRREDLHSSDTVQEKLSLVARFGVSIYYGSPDKKEYMKIVEVLADKYHIQIPKEELFREANKWELNHGGLSGRTAAQFINYVIGTRT